MSRSSNTINILKLALKNGSLIIGDKYACAIGNLLSHKLGFDIIKSDDGYHKWTNKSGDTVTFDWLRILIDLKYEIDVKNQRSINTIENRIKKWGLGYTGKELLQINKSFEKYNKTDKPVAISKSEFRKFCKLIKSLG